MPEPGDRRRLMPLLEVRGLEVTYGALRAVRGVDLAIARGEAVGLVGESGCGKSSLARAMVRLITPRAGTVVLDGHDVSRAPERALRPLRRRVQLVFQDSAAALNPRLRVERAIGEPLAFHRLAPREGLDAAIDRTLALVGLDATVRRRFPHELSGGQRQRVAIARALAVQPELLIADEPISSLDASIRAQVLNLFVELRERLSLSLLLVSHDLHAVRHVAGRVLVMYLGKIVESLPAAGLDRSARHPYTRLLLGLERDRGAPSDPPSPIAVPPGCAFAGRCPLAIPECARAPAPELAEAAPGHLVACPVALRGAVC